MAGTDLVSIAIKGFNRSYILIRMAQRGDSIKGYGLHAGEDMWWRV